MKRLLSLIPFLCLCFVKVQAQDQIPQQGLDSLKAYELRLMGLGEEMVRSFDEATRISSGKNFIINLGRALRVTNSFYFPFDSLKNVSILRSPDELFRIITWNIATNDENFRYFGVIQMNPKKVKDRTDNPNIRSFYPLIDRSDSLQNFLYRTTDADHWFGASYYKLIKTSYKKHDYYTLLGWDGSTAKTNKKVADVLSFDNGVPVFGAPIFDLKKKTLVYRLVFEFNNTATMTLKYNEKKKYLIYENIIPDKPQNTGNFEFYYPDGSFDYCVWKSGKWEKQPNMLNEFD